MKWSIAKARQQFSKLLQAARRKPQAIFNRNRLVAVVVDAKTFKEFSAWSSKVEECTIADSFSELRRLCSEEGYILEVPERKDRGSSFAEALHELPR